MRKLFLTILTVLIIGCANPPGGISEYTIKPIILEDGTILCCEAKVYNSKNYKHFTFKMEKKSNGTFLVELDETGIDASTPMKVTAEANTKVVEAILDKIPEIK